MCNVVILVLNVANGQRELVLEELARVGRLCVEKCLQLLDLLHEGRTLVSTVKRR